MEAARIEPLSYGIDLNTFAGHACLNTPSGYSIDHTRSKIGDGRAALEADKSAMRRWRHFGLGWIRVANPETEIEPEEMIAVEAHTLGLWSVNISRILYVIDEPNRFGFGYGITGFHVERGEERFLLEFDWTTGAVYYELLAVSQPAHWLAALPIPTPAVCSAGLLRNRIGRCGTYLRESNPQSILRPDN